MGQQIDLIAGLGNPAQEYQTTRHNAGFWFADLLARRRGAVFARQRKFQADTADIEISGQRIRLIKPQTWMNESGRAVSAAMRYYRIPAEHILIAYDELDLPPGRAKLKFAGGDAGHRGIRSVIEHIGPEFWRLRLGVGHPGPGRRESVLGHVLRRASSDEEQLILDTIADAVEVLPVLIESGAQIARNRLHAPRPEPHGEAEADGNGGSPD